MSALDGLSTLDGVADFLAEEVVPAVPRELAGEVRAAVKLLRTARVELAVRHREVAAETADLLVLCEATATGDDVLRLELLRDRADQPGLDLAEQDTVLTDLREVAARITAGLARADDPRLAVFVDHLGAHAARRLDWQAVFPTTQGGPS